MPSGYFTDEQADAKNWQMLKQRKEARAEVARLRNELSQFMRSWIKLADLCGEDLSARAFKIDDDAIVVQNPTQRHATIATVPRAHFGDTVVRLLGSLEKARAEEASLTEALRALDVDLGH
jgi:hypothetical protein